MRKVLVVLTLLLGTLIALAPIAVHAANPSVIMKTSHGDIQLELFQDAAPKTVANFIGLAEGTKEFTDPKTNQKSKRPYYDGLTFHRVIKGFMIQGGDPLGNGRGGPGYKFEDEINAGALGLDKIQAINGNRPHPYLGISSRQAFHQVVVMPIVHSMGIKSQEELKKRVEEIQKRIDTITLKELYENQGYVYNDKLKSYPPKKGNIAMANAGPNTNGSQFFINLVDTPHLTGRHTVFGKVTEGMNVVEEIGEVKVGPGAQPEKEIKIISVRLKK